MTEFNHSIPQQIFFFTSHGSVHSPVDDKGNISWRLECRKWKLKQSTGFRGFFAAKWLLYHLINWQKSWNLSFKQIHAMTTKCFSVFCIEICYWSFVCEKNSIVNLPESAIWRKTQHARRTFCKSAFDIDCASTWFIKVSPMICEICQIHSKADTKKSVQLGRFLKFCRRDKRILSDIRIVLIKTHRPEILSRWRFLNWN